MIDKTENHNTPEATPPTPEQPKSEKPIARRTRTTKTATPAAKKVTQETTKTSVARPKARTRSTKTITPFTTTEESISPEIEETLTVEKTEITALDLNTTKK